MDLINGFREDMHWARMVYTWRMNFMKYIFYFPRGGALSPCRLFPMPEPLPGGRERR
jgi:hypothetical protein